MRKIKYIVFHCTGTSKTAKVKGIFHYWKVFKKWREPGYHILVMPDGVPVIINPFNEISNGVQGFNNNCIHIGWVGGKHKDDRTPQQKTTLNVLAIALKAAFPEAEIKGHRDFPGVAKACPQFDSKEIAFFVEANTNLY